MKTPWYVTPEAKAFGARKFGPLYYSPTKSGWGEVRGHVLTLQIGRWRGKRLRVELRLWSAVEGADS